MQPKISPNHNTLVQIQTSNRELCDLPQWKIEAARLLHTKQELLAFKEKYHREELYPLSLNTINKEQLDLFSQALEQKNFTKYYQKKCTPEEKRLLINLAGENQLMSPILTILLAIEYFDINIVQHIASFLTNEMNAVHNHLKRSLVIHNLTLSGYEQKKTAYRDNGYIAAKNDGEYNYIPRGLGKNYNGFTIRKFIELKNEKYILLSTRKKNENERYFVTPIKPISNSDTDQNYTNIRIWLVKSTANTAGTEEIKKDLVHTNQINKIAFSKNRHYLITSSFEPHSELIITYLKKQDQIPAFSHLLLKEHVGEIGGICFNNLSTILAIGSENGIQLLDPKTLSLIKKLDMPLNGMFVDHLQFNKTGTILAASIALQQPMQYAIQLYDVSKPDSITKIAHLEKTIEQIQALKFASDNELIITGTDHVLVIDGLATIIIETEMMPRGDAQFSAQTAVLMPEIDMLVTARATDEKYCDTKIWDMHSKEILATLLLNATKVNGVGVSENGQSIITTHQNWLATQTDLYTTNAAAALEWIQKMPNLLQKYLLLRLYRAKKIDDSIDLYKKSVESRVFKHLPTTPSNVKRLVQNHLLKKSISK